MSDQHLLDSFAREAGRDVVPPDFDALVTTSKRRRRTMTATAAVAVAAVVSIATVGLPAAGDHQGAPVGPGPTTSTSQAPTRDPAAAIVDSAAARLTSLAVLPDNSAARAVVWRVQGRGSALAVTADGFKTRVCLLLRGSTYPGVSPAGPGWFFIAQPGPSELVSPSGARRAVSLRQRPGPLATGEFLVQAYSGGMLAVNPATAVAHPIALPRETNGAYGDQNLIWSIGSTTSSQGAVHSFISWSTDGGRTWLKHDLAVGATAYYSAVPSAPGTIAVSETGDVTVIPLTRLVVSDDAGASWHTFVEPVHATAVVNWTAALPDGTLLADVLAWSDQPAGQPGSRPTGLLRSVGTDWTRLVAVHPTLPAGEPETASTLAGIVATSMDRGTLSLYVVDASGGGLVTSTDGGSTWTTVRSR